MSRTDDEIDPDKIDFDKVVWDARYRRAVIERLNREAEEAAAPEFTVETPRPRRREGTG